MNHDGMTMTLEDIGYISFMVILSRAMPRAHCYVLKCHGHFIVISDVSSNVTVSLKKVSKSQEVLESVLGAR